MAHKKFIQRLLRCKIPLICCLRGEEKTHMEKGENGQKGKVITDEFSTPIFDQRFIFELLLNLENISVNGQGGYVIPRKITHPGVAPLLPKENEQLGIKHGELLAAWCANAGGGKVASAPVSQPVNSLGKLKKELFEITKAQHGGDVSALEQFLIDEILIPDNAKLADLTAEEITNAISKYKAKFK